MTEKGKVALKVDKSEETIKRIEPILGTFGFTLGTVVGALGGLKTSEILEKAGLPRESLIIGCISLLVVEVNLRRLGKKELDNLKEIKGKEERIKQIVKLCLLHSLEVTLVGLNLGLGMNIMQKVYEK